MEVQKPQTVQIKFNNKTITLHNVTIVEANPALLNIGQFGNFNAVNKNSSIINETIPSNSPKIVKLKSPTSSPVAKKKFTNGTQEDALDLTFQCLFCDNIFNELDNLVDHMRQMHPDIIDLPRDDNEISNIEETNKNTHSTTNSVGEDDFEEYIEEEEEEEEAEREEDIEQFNSHKENDETESLIEYDESTTCSSSRPPSSPPSPEYELHVPFSRMEEIRREMEMEREKELLEREKKVEINVKVEVLEEEIQNEKSPPIEVKTEIKIEPNEIQTPVIRKESVIRKIEDNSLKILDSVENIRNILKSTSEMAENGRLPLKNPINLESDERSGKFRGNLLENSNSHSESNQIEKLKNPSHAQYPGVLRHGKDILEQEKLASIQEETMQQFPDGLELLAAAGSQQVPYDLENLEFFKRLQENMQEFNQECMENLPDCPEFYPPDSEECPEGYPDGSEENSEEEDAFDYDDFDHLSMLEPICELKSEDDDKSSVNQEAMELYRMAMEVNYQQNGIKRRGKRKIFSNVDENSSSSSNGVQFQAPLPAIKLPQGPGRGRRREIDDAEMDAINSSGDCFFQCTLCDKSYKFAGDLAKHVRSHTLNRPYQCSICEKSFTHIGSLNTHLRIHSGDRPYKCNYNNCDKSFTQSNSLMVHMKSHLSNKPFQCDICNKGFLNASSLAMHQKTHTDNEPITCPECFKEFKHANLLSEHMLIHKQSFLYQCSLCRQKFEQACILVQHMKEHTGDKPFRCEICHKSFTQPGSLNTHLRIHTGEKPFKCQYCDKSFTQASSLSVHVRVHLGEKQFKCKFCEKYYSQSSYLQKHIQQIHMIGKETSSSTENGGSKIESPSKVAAISQQENGNQQSQEQSQDAQKILGGSLFECPLCAAKYESTTDLILHLRSHC